MGLFNLSKIISRRKLIILAYHGFEINDEASFHGKLYMKRSTLERRMEYLKKNYNILKLDEALTRLKKNRLPQNSVVVTADDGWYSTLSVANKVFLKHSIPYTIYVTSYYAQKQIPVLNVLLRYMLWAYKKKATAESIVEVRILGEAYDLRNNKQEEALCHKLISHMNDLSSNEEQVEFIKKISNLLGIDYNKIEKERRFGLMTSSEISRMAERGVDIQLHTHTHAIPFGKQAEFESELLNNQRFLNACVKNRLKHFCYPSGAYDSTCERILKENNIESAVTCEPGLVTGKTNCYYLPRFLDGENIPQIVFEAELSGFADILRMCRAYFKSLLTRRNIS